MTQLMYFIEKKSPCNHSQGQIEELAAENRALLDKFTAEEKQRKELSERCQVGSTCRESPSSRLNNFICHKLSCALKGEMCQLLR